MRIEDLRIIKNLCIILGYLEEIDKWTVLLGKIGKPYINCTEKHETIAFDKFSMFNLINEKTFNLNIPFSINDGKAITMITLGNKSEYETILTVLEAVL